MISSMNKSVSANIEDLHDISEFRAVAEPVMPDNYKDNAEMEQTLEDDLRA